jgi:hypothetical protein
VQPECPTSKKSFPPYHRLRSLGRVGSVAADPALFLCVDDKTGRGMSEQHYLKPKQVRKLVEEVARERRGSTLGYTPAEQAAVSTDPESYERGNAFNPVFIYPPENPEPVELPKVPDFKPETDATALFADAAAAIETLNEASEKFGQEYGQPNVRLIEARAEADYLRNALAKAQQQLAEIEAEGDSTDRFKTAIEKAQTLLRGLAHRAVAIVKNQLQLQKIGRVLHHNNLPTALKDELSLHVRTIEVLRGVETFQYQDLPKDAKEDVLKSRAAKVVEQIDHLARNLDADQASYNAK